MKYRQSLLSSCCTIEFTVANIATHAKDKLLSNSANKSRFINLLKKVLIEENIQVEVIEPKYFAKTVVDSIVSVTSTGVKCLASENIDLLVLLSSVVTEKHLYFLKPNVGAAHEQIYSIDLIREKFVDYCKYLPILHAFTGCQTTSAIYNYGKISIINSFMKSMDVMKIWLDLFNNPANEIDGIATAGNFLFYKIYKLTDATSLCQSRHKVYHRVCASKKNKITPALLPPTDNAAKFHSLRVFYQVQLWTGNREINPTYWGWKKNDILHYLQPITTTHPVAPDTLLKEISCACKTACDSSQCTCRKSECRLQIHANIAVRTLVQIVRKINPITTLIQMTKKLLKKKNPSKPV